MSNKRHKHKEREPAQTAAPKEVTVNDLYRIAMDAKQRGDLQTAFNNLMMCVQALPQETTFRLNLAAVCLDMAKPCEQLYEIAYGQACEAARLKPDLVGHWLALAEVALNCQKFAESVAAFEKVTTMDPENSKAWGLLGFAHARLGRGKEAKKCYERAVEIDPENGTVHFLLSCMFVNEDYNPKRQAFHGQRGHTCEKPSTYPIESEWNAAHGMLGAGDYENGWKAFEARLKRNATNQGQLLQVDRFKKPMWDQQRDCSVLVSHEMGLGDCFLFMRFLPLFRDKFNLKVIFECMPPIMTLAASNLPGIEVIEFGTASEHNFDYHLPIMSLPYVMGTTNDSVPWDGPYIKADPEKIEEWKEKIPFNSEKMNIGICWYGGARADNSSAYETDKKRSLTFDQIQPILAVPVNFISLQTDTDLLPNVGLKSFADTAAVMHLLDGVVTVDTAVANLAGAMGKTTWLMNRYDTCWRWSEYLSTPWFPTIIDIRQRAHGEWQPVIDQVVNSLGIYSDKSSY